MVVYEEERYIITTEYMNIVGDIGDYNNYQEAFDTTHLIIIDTVFIDSLTNKEFTKYTDYQIFDHYYSPSKRVRNFIANENLPKRRLDETIYYSPCELDSNVFIEDIIYCGLDYNEVYYNELGVPCTSNYNLVYYRNGNVEFGDPFDMETLSVQEQNSISLKYSTTREGIYILGLDQSLNYQMFDISGKLIENGTTSDFIRTNILEKGAYFVVLQNGNVIRFAKDF